jgi:hypothetical protein
MTALASPLDAPPQALPWYRVIPPFAWFTQPKQPKRLRPAGHSAWVEAMHQPVLFAISLAFTSAGLYTLAKDYVIKAFTAIGAGDYGQIVPVSIALFVIVITGGAIEIAFLTAASRLRMHLLRHEWGWTAVSTLMLLLTIGVEGLTCSYMFYLIEAPKLSPAWAAFMSNIPTLLFFVRAFAGLVCAAYLIIGVLPFVIRPDDVRREMAAEAGAAKVAIIQRLLHVVNELSVWQMLSIYEPVAAIFRDNAGYTSQQAANRLALEALGNVKQRLVATNGWRADYESLFAQVEKDYESNAGLELERYDAQTHTALTQLQERLRTAAEGQGTGGIPNEQFEQLVHDLTALREQVAALPTDSVNDVPEMEYRFAQWADQLKAQFTGQINALRAQIAGQGQTSGVPLPPTDTDEFADLIVKVRGTLVEDERSATVPDIIAELARRGYAPISEVEVARALVRLGDRLATRGILANTVAAGGGAPVRTPPKPGTKRFNEWVYTTAQRLLGEDRMTIFNIAQELKVDAQLVQAAIEALKGERIRRLKPGKELTPDPVLDML